MLSRDKSRPWDTLPGPRRTEPLWTVKDLAERFGTKYITLHNALARDALAPKPVLHIKRGAGKKPTRVYRLAEVETWWKNR